MEEVVTETKVPKKFLCEYEDKVLTYADNVMGLLVRQTIRL